VSAIPLLVMGLISYTVYTEEMTKQTDLSMESMMIQTSGDLEWMLSSIKQYYYYLEWSAEEDMDWLAQTDSIPYTQYSHLESAQAILSGAVYSRFYEYVGNYAYINLQKGWILTNRGMYTVDEMRNYHEFQVFLRDIEANPSELFWANNRQSPLPQDDGLYHSRTLELSGIQLVLKKFGDDSINQLLLVQLNMEALGKNLQQSKGMYEISLLDGNGKEWYATSPELQRHMQEHPEDLQEGIHNIKLENGSTWRILVSDLSTNRLRYVVAYNMGTIRESAYRLASFSLLLVLGLIILLFLCRGITSIAYRPVKNLVSDIRAASAREQEEEEKGKADAADEWKYLKDHFLQLSATSENLGRMVKEQEKLLQEQFMTRLLRGELSQETISQNVERFRLGGARIYSLMAVLTLLDQESAQENELQSTAFILTIKAALPPQITDRLIAAPFGQGDQILLLLGGGTPEELEEKVYSLHADLDTFIQEHFQCSILTGVSQNFRNLKYLKTAYSECNETFRNTGEDAEVSEDITFFKDISQTDTIQSYDYTAENALTNAVNNGNLEESVQLVDKFVNSLYNRRITHYNRSFALYRMLTSILTIIYDAGLSINQVLEGETEDIFSDVQNLYDKEQLKQHIITNFIKPCVEALKEYRYKASSDTMRRIREFVEEAKGDITLTECADKLNYHPSYIWKVLKVEGDMTFTDLVTAEKLKLAKQLLINSQMSIAEIAETLSYSNTQNFIRFFQKYEHRSPGKYRKEEML
jgi:AraC-like DNA-binding protein